MVVLFFLSFSSFSACEIKETHTVNVSPWQSSFQAFVEEIGQVAGKARPPNADEMHTRLDDMCVLTDGAGHVIDCNPPGATLQYEANRLFGGRRFEWTIPIRQAEWADSARRAVLLTVPTGQHEAQSKESQAPKWIKVRLFGLQTLPPGNALKVSGVLGRPATVSGECQLAGVCVVYFPNNKEDEYGLLIVVDGTWRPYGPP